MQHIATELTDLLRKIDNASEAIRQARVEVKALMEKHQVLHVSVVTDVSGQTHTGTD
jgi:hypothetical protein